MAVSKKNRTAQYSTFLANGNFAEKIRRTLGSMSTRHGSQYFTATDVAHEMADRFNLSSINTDERRDLKERCATNLYQMHKNGSKNQRAHRVIRSPGKINPAVADGGRIAFGYHVGPITEEGVNADTAKNDAAAAQAAFDNQRDMKEKLMEWFRNAPISTVSDALVEAQMIVHDRHFAVATKKEQEMAELEKQVIELERKLEVVHKASKHEK